ncbi:MAG: tetratricopeptide repeat protein [Tannerellaceae bacterium]|nr:tetratricopeptide repeat protein [Tannerellaceae bacterium]
MSKSNMSDLLQRYLSARDEGKDIYFDANEIDDLLESFEESNDFTYYGEVLALGLKFHPSSTDLYLRQCKLYVYNEEYDSALALIETIALQGNQELDLLRLECYCALNQYEEVVTYTDNLRENECEYLEQIFEYTAPILNDLDMTAEAHDYISRGLKLYPDNMILKDEFCYVLEIEGDIDQAIRICNELIDKNPYSNDYWFSLGRLYSMTADFDKAIEAFDFALTCDDSDNELKILKSYCLYMNENYEKAIDVYNEIARNGNLIIDLKPLIAECYIKLEKFEKGYELLKEIIYNPDSNQGLYNYRYEAFTYINYVKCCIETERLKEAVATLKEAANLFPDNIRILSILALSYIENNEEEKALETTERLYQALENQDENNPEDYNTLLRAGQILYLRGEVDRALKYYRKIYEEKPNLPYLNLHLAMAYLSKGDMKKFGEHYKLTSPEELLEYFEISKTNMGKAGNVLYPTKHIPPEDLSKEYLRNKDNKN